MTTEQESTEQDWRLSGSIIMHIGPVTVTAFRYSEPFQDAEIVAQLAFSDPTGTFETMLPLTEMQVAELLAFLNNQLELPLRVDPQALLAVDKILEDSRNRVGAEASIDDTPPVDHIATCGEVVDLLKRIEVGETFRKGNA